MKQKKILLLMLAFLFLFPLTTEALEENNTDEIYLLVINRLSLEDFNEMKNLKQLSEDGSLGFMNTRGTNGYYGAESFITINSSSKAYANDISADFIYSESTNEIINSTMNRVYNLNENNRYTPKIGFLGDKLKSANKKTALFADNTLEEENLLYSGLIGMDSEGVLSEGIIEKLTLDDKKYPYGKKMNYKKILTKSIESDSDFKILDIGDLERLYRYSNNYTESEYIEQRKNILKDIDIFIGKLLNEINLNQATLIVTSPNAADPIVEKNKLSPILFFGKGISRGELISSTTNRTGIVANIDLAPTILELFGVDSSGAIGKTISFKEDEQRSLGDKIIEKDKIYTVSSLRYKLLLYYGIYSILILSSVILLKLGRFRLTRRFAIIRKVLLEMILIIPTIYLIVSTMQPRNKSSYIGIIVGLIIISLKVLYDSRELEINKKLLYFSSFNIILLTLDLVLKGSLSQFSVLSHDPIIGARYYGMGNEMVGILIGSISILLRQLKQRGIDRKLNIAILLFALIFIGSPKLGANVGGALALLVAFIFYLVFEMEIKLDIKKIILIGIIGVFILGVVSFIDINLNPNTTHLGNTILSIKEEGITLAFQIVFRKLLMNIKLIGSSFWTIVLLINLLVFGNDIYLNENYNPDMLKVNIAMVMGTLAGFLLNDSGLILAALCMNFLSTEQIIIGSVEIGKS